MVTVETRRLRLFDMEELRKFGGWILAVGIAEIVLGVVAIAAATFTTVASVVLFGVLLFSGGVLAIAHGFRQRRGTGFFLDVATGVLYAIAGLMVFSHPVAAAASLTLVLALFLMAGGMFRMIAALSDGVRHCPWVFLNGVITLALGVMIWRQWPVSGLWVIGLFIGIEMLSYGFALALLGAAARRVLRDIPSRLESDVGH